VTLGKVSGTSKIEKKIQENSFLNAPIRGKNPLKFENDLKWPSFRATEIIYRKEGARRPKSLV